MHFAVAPKAAPAVAALLGPFILAMVRRTDALPNQGAGLGTLLPSLGQGEAPAWRTAFLSVARLVLATPYRTSSSFGALFGNRITARRFVPSSSTRWDGRSRSILRYQGRWSYRILADLIVERWPHRFPSRRPRYRPLGGPRPECVIERLRFRILALGLRLPRRTVPALAMESAHTEKPVCVVPSWAFHSDFVSRPLSATMSPLPSLARTSLMRPNAASENHSGASASRPGASRESQRAGGAGKSRLVLPVM